jgi:uncharacterized protein
VGGPAHREAVTFIGRTRELEALENAYQRPDSVLLPIYGRRRIGKSELILEFARNKPALYYVGKTAPARLQMAELSREAARVLDEPLLATQAPTDWKTLLTRIVDRYRGDRKLVFALDEFQWMTHASPELPSVLQECWDRQWRKSGKVLVILCGSYVGFMEREVLGKKSPLFGRRTGQIHLGPFGYQEAQAFHPDWSLMDRAKAFFVCGGVPMYLKTFGTARSVEQGIETLILDEFGPLFREPDFLLREELREVENYYAVLVAIAGGCKTATAIADRSGLPERSLHYYLQQLIELGYVARRHPLTGRPPAQRHVRYVLEDALLRFWFRFVFPNQSFIQQAGPRRAFRERIRPELDGYFGACFERLCRDALARLYAREGVGGAFQVGEYWDKQTQIDVVGLREDGWVDIGECKWGSVRSAPRLVQELEEKVRRYPNPQQGSIQRRVFTRQAPRAKPASAPGVAWHDLADLYR